jgi:hypothetical protein
MAAVPFIVSQWAQTYNAGIVTEVEPRPWWKPEWRAWRLHDGSALLFTTSKGRGNKPVPWITQSPVLWGGEGIR